MPADQVLDSKLKWSWIFPVLTIVVLVGMYADYVTLCGAVGIYHLCWLVSTSKIMVQYRYTVVQNSITLCRCSHHVHMPQRHFISPPFLWLSKLNALCLSVDILPVCLQKHLHHLVCLLSYQSCTLNWFTSLQPAESTATVYRYLSNNSVEQTVFIMYQCWLSCVCLQCPFKLLLDTRTIQ